ncbi:hypothetical protein IWW37_003650 [Coemansia sp. RSA 2050]|nr:hypothetical protein IWW37_003650 [Coemansia sp. RSA 2050]KAJ2732750.1 hypothetical protein IW152_003553 [Coemansia sp. BCRC 34962]
MSAINLAGFIVYRISPRKPIEYLLLNNSYEHRAHWCPPKGKRNSNEDEFKAAVRETYAQTELHSQDYVTDSAFRAELKYVDGIRPKQVVYFLARFAPSPNVTSHLCDSSGLKYQWCALDQALDKVVFQSMQNILTQAEDYIEGIREEILASNSRTCWQNDGEDERRTYRGDSKFGGDQSENGANTWRTSRNDAGGIEGRFKKMSVSDGSQGQWKEASGGGGMRDREGSSTQQQRRPQDNPLYKTRLCEKFEQEGECPYNQKCVFAHGEQELRVRENAPTNEPRGSFNERQHDYASPAPSYPRQQQPHQHGQQQQYHQQSRQHQQPLLSPQSQQFQQPARVSQNPGLKFNSNPLYKTRLCQRFTEQGDCPYNDKCQFAHGEQELRIAPEQSVQPYSQVKSPRDGQYPSRTPTDQSSNGLNRGPFDMAQAWRKGPSDSTAERGQAPRMAKNTSWSSTDAVALAGKSSGFGDDGSLEPPPGYPLPNRLPKNMSISDDDAKAAPLAAPLNTPVPQKSPAPASTKAAHTNVANSAAGKRQQEPKAGSLKSESGGGERPWLKVVELSTEEMQQMGSPLLDTVSTETAKQKQPSKAVSLECRLTKELTEFFAKGSGGSQEPTLQAALKEITQVEFRNNLSKQQLLNICIATLFAPCKGLGVSDAVGKHSELLSKVVSKQQDQVFMLNAWLRLMAEDEHAAAWQKRASEILGALYKVSLLDEEVFIQWFEKKRAEDHSPVIASMQPFAHWLATAEEE